MKNITFPKLRNKEIKLKKILPLVSLQDFGKNELLNILFNNNIENKMELAGNKFINIFRYNPEIKEPQFYHLNIKFKENYVFFKDEKYKEVIGYHNILNEYQRINKNIIENKETKLIDNFFITEISSISFSEHKNFFIKYDLCDFPLLSKDKLNNENKIEDKEENLDINNFNKEILEIIKNDIQTFIIILDINNYKDNINYKIISQLKKIINKQIINSLMLFDISKAQENYSNEYNNFFNNLINHFPDFEIFNVCLNKITEINFIEIESGLLLNKSFYHLLKYQFCIFNYLINKDEFISGSLTDKFMEYLEKLIEIDIDKLKDKLENITEKENMNIDNAINDLKEKDNIELIFLSNDNDMLESPDDDEYNNNKNILKMVYIYYKEKKFKNSYFRSTNKLIDYFKNHDINQNIFENEMINLEIKETDKIDTKIISNLKNINRKLRESDILKNNIKNTIKNSRADINLLKEPKLNHIYIPFLGPSNSGKSTLLNAIIGKDILQMYGEECTKKGIIISYSDDNEPDITIRNAKLVPNRANSKTKYHFEYDKKIIASGFSNVKEILKSLNYKYAEKEENSFYYVRTKIKLFDEINLNKYFKKNIFLIDFPGNGTSYQYEKNNILPKIFQFCNCFSFIVKDTLLYEIENQKLIDKVLETIKISQDKFSVGGFIDSCLFICNIRIDNTQAYNDNDIIKAKNEIKEIVKLDDTKNINVCFLKGLNYLNHINNFNFFFNIEETIKEEYIKFNENKNYYYYTNIKKLTFEQYFDDIITKKLEELNLHYSSNNEISKPDINKIKKEIDHFPLGKFSEKIKIDIANKFYFAQKNLNIKFNNENFIIEFKKLIEDTFNKKIKIKEKIIQKQIDIYEKLLEQKFSEKISYESFNKLKITGENVIDEMEKLSNKIKKNIDNKDNIISGFLSIIFDFLSEMKKSTNDFLKTKDLKKIKKEIIEKLSNYIEGLSLSIEKLINEIDKEIFKVLNLWENTPERITFREFFIINTSQKGIDILKEINHELNKCFEDTKLQIFKNKGFFDWIESVIFDDEYLNNFIDIIGDSLTKKLGYIINLILENFKDYNNQMARIIQEKIESLELLFIKLAPEELEKLKNYCEPIMAEIKKDFKNYLSINIFN